MSITIKSNHHWREPLRFWDLTPDELREVGYYVANRWDELSSQFPEYRPDGSDVTPDTLTDEELIQAFERISQDTPGCLTRYRGSILDLTEFRAIPCEMLPAPWQRYQSDSYFSGTVFRWSEDYGEFQIGTYYFVEEE